EYQVSDERTTGIIVFKEECVMCYISKTWTFGIDTIYSGNDDFLKEYSHVISEFVATPVEDRYPVKKYYVKPILPDFINAQHIYLNRHTYIWNDSEIVYTLNTRNQSSDYQTQFTMEEIKEIIPKEDMDKFQFIPVEEEKQ